MHTKPTIITGGASTDPEAPEIQTPEAAERYCDEVYLRYQVEAAKVQPGNPNRLTLQQVTSIHRKSMMLLGRAIAAPDVLYRVGVLDWSRFAILHKQATGVSPGDKERDIMTSIESRDAARSYIETHLDLLRDKREGTIPRPGRDMGVRGQHHAQAVWLTHLGQFIESLGLLQRQRLLDEVAFEAYHAQAMATLVPTVRPGNVVG